MKRYRAFVIAGLTLISACAQRTQLPDRHSVQKQTMGTDQARAKSIGVTITGVQHLGPNFSIDSFMVDDYPAGRVGRGGGGGSFVCCVRLPRVWRSGLKVEVRWKVSDWSQADESETERGNFKSVRPLGIYKAAVPVEYYASPEDLYVHFLGNERVRVVSTPWSSISEKHPISRMKPESNNATQGIRIYSMYEESN